MMKILCTVQVENRRLSSSSSSNRPTKHARSTLGLCRDPKSETDYYFILFTKQDKNGTSYNVKGNIKQILTRFVNEGKCTIQFRQPEHNLLILADSLQLKSLLHMLRRILDEKVCTMELGASSMAVTPIKDIAPRKMVIKSRSEYPLKGFPRTLEELHIKGISRCGVDKAILQLVNLRVLDLSNNIIETIPEDLNKLCNLKELYLSQNVLVKSQNWNWMGGTLAKSLRLLDLNYNHLTFVPNQIKNLHNLSTLHVSYNSLESIPHCIGNLKNLKFLTMSDNFITALPGSMKLLRLQSLDISNNCFERGEAFRSPIPNKPLPVCTLKEYAGRKVLGSRLPYESPGTLPTTLVQYLDDARYCVCGKACLEMYLSDTQTLTLMHIAERYFSREDTRQVPMDCHFCSYKCYSTHFLYRARNPIVR